MAVRVDMSGVPAKLSRIKTNRQLGLFASSEAMRLMDKFVPWRTGDLAASANTSEPWKVSYTAPYAQKVYEGNGLKFRKDFHPLAMSHWDKGVDKAKLAALITGKLRSM